MSLRLELTARKNVLEVRYFLQKILGEQSLISVGKGLHFLLAGGQEHVRFLLSQCYKSRLSNKLTV